MINVEIYRAAESASKFPALMQSIKDPSLIILFTRPGVGTVISSSAASGNESAGYFSDQWIPTLFTPFHGEITLSNGDGGVETQEDPACEGCPGCDASEEDASLKTINDLFARLGFPGSIVKVGAANAG